MDVKTTTGDDVEHECTKRSVQIMATRLQTFALQCAKACVDAWSRRGQMSWSTWNICTVFLQCANACDLGAGEFAQRDDHKTRILTHAQLHTATTAMLSVTVVLKLMFKGTKNYQKHSY